MKKMVKLFVAILACGLFLAGCGGGGGSSGNGGPGGGSNDGGNEDNNSFVLIESVFPLFDYIPDNATGIRSGKTYKVSAEQMADFVEYVLIEQGYQKQVGNSWMKEGIRQGISAQVLLDFEKSTMDLALISSSEPTKADVVQDSTFNEIFAGIEGNITHAKIIKYYYQDISDWYDDYALRLDALEFDFDCVGLVCEKDSGDVVYLWETLDKHMYSYTVKYK
ncbi:MAG: hypothetical protein LBH45_02560 [Campylobacteraceae bacterium]|jgi:hypothetical protein|nr:hypothetical protein [Campylobacteraceae bacterium]